MKMIYLITLISIMFSCSIKNNNQQDSAKDFSENIEELSGLIRLDIRPNAAQWKLTKLGVENSRIPGPSDYTLVAILKYDKDAFQKIQIEIEKNNVLNNKIYLDSTSIKEWYPKTIRDCFLKEDNYYRINPRAYNATVFAQFPLRSGFCFMQENTNSVFVSLYP